MKVLKYDILGKLPDPFLKEDGTRVSDRSEWEAQRAYLKKSSVLLQYGDILPDPEFLTVQLLCPHTLTALNTALVKVTTGKKNCPMSFLMRISLPVGFRYGQKYPIVIDGDMCYNYSTQNTHTDYYMKNGIVYVCFNRTELVYDCAWRQSREDGLKGPVYDAYGKEYTFGCFQGWAWGFSRALDALEQMGLVNREAVAFTGHSRGAKSALLAAVLDERCTVCMPIQTNGGGAACYRTHLFAVTEAGEERQSETMADMAVSFPHWYTEELCTYADRENELPFDSHYLKALLAPRHLIVGEAEDDIWGNSIGSYQTNDAAKPVYEFLGVPNRIHWYWHGGTHAYLPEDAKILAEYLSSVAKGETPDTDFECAPFTQYGRIFEYTCPNAKRK